MALLAVRAGDAVGDRHRLSGFRHGINELHHRINIVGMNGAAAEIHVHLHGAGLVAIDAVLLI